MQNLKRNDTNELIYKTETDSQTQRMNLWIHNYKLNVFMFSLCKYYSTTFWLPFVAVVFVVVATHSVTVVIIFLIMSFPLIDFKIFSVSNELQFQKTQKTGIYDDYLFDSAFDMIFSLDQQSHIFFISSGKSMTVFFQFFLPCSHHFSLWASSQIFDETSNFFFIFNLYFLFLTLSYLYAAL